MKVSPQGVGEGSARSVLDFLSHSFFCSLLTKPLYPLPLRAMSYTNEVYHPTCLKRFQGYPARTGADLCHHGSPRLTVIVNPDSIQIQGRIARRQRGSSAPPPRAHLRPELGGWLGGFRLLPSIANPPRYQPHHSRTGGAIGEPFQERGLPPCDRCDVHPIQFPNSIQILSL